jgi:hypothetical protein
MAQSRPVPVRVTLHKLFPAEFLIALAKATAAVQRVRKVKLSASPMTVIPR